MLTLSIITLASGLAFTPAPTGLHTTAAAVRYERARQTLDRMTSEAHKRLQHKVIEEALNSGIRTFKMTLNEQSGTQSKDEVAVSGVPQTHQSITIK